MADYTELVSTLRECSKQGKRYGMAVIYMGQAADAIEELSKENEQFAKMAKVFIDGMNEISEKCADIAGIQAEPPKEETE